MKVWLTHEKGMFSNNSVTLWFDEPIKVYDKFLKKERWTLGEGAVFYYPNLTLSDVNYLVSEENSPLEIDIPFLSEFVVDKTKLIQQKTEKE